MEKLDRISDLPDPLIQHILTFLPSTKQAIQTTVLSKRWKNQWSGAPVLVFPPDRYSSYNSFLKFVNNTLFLHACSKIKKFYLYYPKLHQKDPDFDEKIRFATNKQVEDLTLIHSFSPEEYLVLPQYVFNYTCLVKFYIKFCECTPEGKVNWAHLKELRLENCKLSNQAMQHVLSGIPLVESLEIIRCFGIHKLVISYKYLKSLVLRDFHTDVLKISCPDLRKLIIRYLRMDDNKLRDQAIQNIVSHSLLLESLEITFGHYGPKVIASESLKRLDLWVFDTDVFELSCPKLEEMSIAGLLIDFKFMNLQSLLRANLTLGGLERGNNKNLEDIMHHLRHVNELRLGISTMETFAVIEERFSPVLCVKYLTLDIANWDKYEYGIACVLRNSPMLESLVIRFKDIARYDIFIPKLDSYGENYWSSKASDFFDCLVSHLKTVKMSGVMKIPRLVLNFVQFLLQNARVLENMVVLVEKNRLTSNGVDAFQELLSYPRRSENVVVELQAKNRKDA